MTVINLAKIDEFESAVKYTKLLVIHFYADWVDQCELMSKVVDEMSVQAEYKDVKFAKLPAEKVPEVSLKYNVSAVPTFILLNGGKEVARVEGANPHVLTSKVKELATGISTPTVVPSPAKVDLTTRLKSLINASPVMLFMKGTAAEPRCGFSRKTVEILNSLNVKYKTFDILADNDVREGLKKYSDWPTYPQLYVNGELIGGLDIIKEMLESGELQEKLKMCKTTNTLEERLKELVNKANVMIFMKGNRENPRCGFSRQLIALLDEIGANFETFDILEDEDVRQGLKKFSNWPTYPQIYVKGSLIGGIDIAKELHANGELKEMLVS